MSKSEFFTNEETSQATAQGWGLHRIYDTKKARWSIEVLPLQFTPTIGARHAMAFVVNRAEAEDALCKKALRLITEFNQGRR
jgi:hypothetical protein